MRNLSTKGLSMSQAQSISNMCNQRALEINGKLTSVNNASKHITVDKVTYVEPEGVPMPGNVVDLLLEKTTLHACQAFLMEAIRAKDSVLKEISRREFVYDVPQPLYERAKDFDVLEPIEEDWGWAQLTDAEYSEYLQVEASAAHIGQFIHHRGVLDRLRHELGSIKGLEWMIIKDGEKTPVKVTKHHTSEELLALHERLAGMHREFEQRVNYYKAKVKNLVTMENARRHNYNHTNGDLFHQEQEALDEKYRLAMDMWRGNRHIALKQFEEKRELDTKDAAALRINVDPRFQTVVDLFLVKSED